MANTQSPVRFVKNACMLALLADRRVVQKPIRRYDATPIASQPTNS